MSGLQRGHRVRVLEVSTLAPESVQAWVGQELEVWEDAPLGFNGITDVLNPATGELRCLMRDRLQPLPHPGKEQTMQTRFTAKQVKHGALEAFEAQAYEFCAADDRGNIFHLDCAKEDASYYGDNDPDKDCEAARVFEVFNHWEGEDIYCEACNKPIHAIYGNPEEEN